MLAHSLYYGRRRGINAELHGTELWHNGRSSADAGVGLIHGRRRGQSPGNRLKSGRE